MSDTLTSEIKASIGWLFQDALDLSTVSDSSQLSYHQTFVDGTNSDQADKIWHDVRTLASGVHEDLTLSALATLLFGSIGAIALAKVKAILLVNTATTAGENLIVGGATSNEWQGPFVTAGDKLSVPADSCLLLMNKKAGWTVSSGSADRLRIANTGAGTITYKIAVLGTSA
jgi:hypothetical protein